MLAEWEIFNNFLEEHVMENVLRWGDTVRRSGSRHRFISLERQALIYSIVLSELCSNNVAKYQALIINFYMVLDMQIPEIEVYGDSKLVINQLLDIYEVKKDNLVPFFRQASHLLKGFENAILNHI
ncbi:UNVERIFIED_CONTAM: hypothetical protein Sradi_3336000 [Sesamum radiatum]|uniref:RNase H type-1 domain-containing protein n=1 Tax=Sesamum radiatum TaxID=300843 RepID=A0AAW2R294_SESRA